MSERDLTQLSAVKGLAAWIGRGSDALVVMVLRGADCALWMAPDITPVAGVAAVEAALPELLQAAEQDRADARAKAAARARKQQDRQSRAA